MSKFLHTLTEANVYGVPVLVDRHYAQALETETDSRREWVHAFHVACYKAVTEYGAKGDPVWDELIRLTDHPKGRE